MSNEDDSSVIGIVVLARHGDREAFYQDPHTYTASSTVITPLGENQEWQLGYLLRSIYLNESSPSYIKGIASLTSKFNVSQVTVQADSGDEGGVIVDSAVALVQGLWPATTLQNTTLANGSTIVSPLQGYQYVPVQAINPDEDISLEGFTDCNTLDTYIDQFYNSTTFAQMVNRTSSFFAQLPSYVGDKAVSLENMWNIFDYMNVNAIHNATFANALPPTFLAQATALANWHEYNINSDVQFNGIGNIAFRAMIPGVISSFEQIANSSSGLKLAYTAISYKPFLSLFNMTGVVANGALPPAIVSYAASVILEVRQPASGGEPVIRFNFKNGTVDETFTTYPMNFAGWDGTSAGDVPMSTFISAFAPAALNSTLEWCQICGVTDSTRGCSTLIAANTPLTSGTHYKISPVGAGFLGAGLTVAVMGALVGTLIFLGVLTLGAGKLRHRASKVGSHTELQSETPDTKE